MVAVAPGGSAVESGQLWMDGVIGKRDWLIGLKELVGSGSGQAVAGWPAGGGDRRRGIAPSVIRAEISSRTSRSLERAFR